MELCKNLTLCCLSPDQNQNTCNYWYTVKTNTITAHTAFNTEKGLRKWLDDRGLSIEGDLPARGTWGVFKIDGSYYQNMTMDKTAFDEIGASNPPSIKVLSNAEYTLGLLTHAPDGCVVVNYLNPNVRDRQVFDYNESREVIEVFTDEERASAHRPRA